MNRIVLGGLAALLALVCVKFPIWGIVYVEREFDVYPIVSRETLASIDEMGEALADFGTACEAHQAAERDAMNGVEYRDGFGSESPDDLVDLATGDMYAAVARRKAVAARADFGLLRSMVLGTQAYTHSIWMCAPAYATFATQINMGFTPTYDPA